MLKFIKNIQKIAPKLSLLKITTELAAGLLNAIVNGSLAHSISNKMKLILEYNFPIGGDTFAVTLDPN